MLYIFLLLNIFAVSELATEDKICLADRSQCDKSDEKLLVDWMDIDYRTFMQKDLVEDKFTAINVTKSARLKPNRDIPDYRSQACKRKSYDEKQATISVIITFHKEARSTLLRTIVSVIERTPEHLLKEIILVDDGNLDPTQGQQLAKIKKVKLVRNSIRQGLIRSRLAGVKAAQAEVLVFLDSHCEVGYTWVQPLLEALLVDRTTIVSPVIDNINLNTFQLEPVSSYLRGGFDWRLDFFWEFITPSQRATRIRDESGVIDTPAIAGGIFAVYKDWFLELGGYDPHMEIWGSEQLELSLRSWRCGGRMVIHPCSRVGHVYHSSVKKVESEENELREKYNVLNKIRTAQVWFDQFYPIFKSTLPKKLRNTEVGDIKERVDIRNNLNCKSMDWYLRTVYPELLVPRNGDIAFGNIYTNQPIWTTCLDPIGHSDSLSVGLNPCLQSNHVQQFHYTNKSTIAQDDFCLTLEKVQVGTQLAMNLCDDTSPRQRWKTIYPKGDTKLKGFLLKNEKYDVCVDAALGKEKGLLAMRCHPDEINQRFMFQYII